MISEAVISGSGGLGSGGLGSGDLGGGGGAVIAEAVVSGAVIAEAVVSGAVISEAAISEAAVSGAVISEGGGSGGLGSGVRTRLGKGCSGKRGSLIAREKFRAPMVKQKETDGQGVEQPALRDEHGKGKAFPGDKSNALVIVPIVVLEPLKTDQAAVEEEAGNGKRSAPAIKRVTEGGRRQQADPDKAADNIDIQAHEEGVE